MTTLALEVHMTTAHGHTSSSNVVDLKTNESAAMAIVHKHSQTIHV